MKASEIKEIKEFLTPESIVYFESTGEPVSIAWEQFIKKHYKISYKKFSKIYYDVLNSKSEKVRKLKYPIFIKYVENDGRSDRNFYCIVSLYVYYQISKLDNGENSISKNIITIKGHNTKKEFDIDNNRKIIKITEKEYKDVEQLVLRSIITSETLNESSGIKMSVNVLNKTLRKIKETSSEVEQLLQTITTNL